MIFLDGLQGMVIGAVNPIVITDDTPIVPEQWKNGQAWIWPDDMGVRVTCPVCKGSGTVWTGTKVARCGACNGKGYT